MKTRFSTIDIIAIVRELQNYIGMRVNQVYDVDSKTYLIKLNRNEEKVILLIESGIRIHTTEFDWPKNSTPSSFSMKLRKHLKNKRLEKLNQLGIDRIVDMQFGINDAAYHIILELYDRGNVILTDNGYIILNILRPRSSDSEDVKFVVHERYPIEKARSLQSGYDKDELCNILNDVKEGDNLKKILMPHVVYGPALLDHVLLTHNLPKNASFMKDIYVPDDNHKLFAFLDDADHIMKEIATKSGGFIIQKIEKSRQDSSDVITNVEFHPYLFLQYKSFKYTEYPIFNKAVDDYFSSMEGQKIDLKALQKEKEALKKLENIKKDHEQRLSKLHESQIEDVRKAELIEMNLDLVENAILAIRSAIANQISWTGIEELIKEAQAAGDPVAKAIKKLKLDINHFSILLSYPHFDSDEEEDKKPQLVDIDLDFSAYANARKYYNLKRAHAKKEQKTVESSEKAFKNAEKKTRQALKEVAITTSISKARKIMWFEKFLWCISSENYLIIAGRDVQQNELLVKRYMKQGDIYVHADVHGASSVIIKNHANGEIPPKTLNEAGTMAVCNSTAWDAKIICGAWWVYHHQVSKTAPSGEYLTTGSFMIRGKKNYLPPSHLIMGFGFMFKLDEESIENHKNERCVKNDDVNQEVFEEEIEELVPSGDSAESDDDDSSSSESHLKEIAFQVEKIVINKDISDETTNDSNFEEIMKEGLKEEISHEIVEFPDTEIKFEVLTETHQENKIAPKPKNKSSNPGTTVIIENTTKKSKRSQEQMPQKCNDAFSKEKSNCQKRGQRGKLKKIKEKYKYQDEEERKLRMEILASAGKNKEEKKNKNKKSNEPKLRTNKPKHPSKYLHFIEVEENIIIDEKTLLNDKNESAASSFEPEINDEDNELDPNEGINEEIKLLNSLTGIPLPEDTLIFAVPICAPYQSMLNFKYKVKLIPGSTKRGKAAKTALQVFLHDKTATTREKELFRSVKDQDISRNLPGKVKLSSASLKKVK